MLWRLVWGASPPQVAGRLALEMERPALSYESIYRFVYAQVKRKKDYDWRNFLPKQKAEEGAAFAQGPEFRRVHQGPAPAVGAACGGGGPG